MQFKTLKKLPSLEFKSSKLFLLCKRTYSGFVTAGKMYELLGVEFISGNIVRQITIHYDNGEIGKFAAVQPSMYFDVKAEDLIRFGFLKNET